MASLPRNNPDEFYDLVVQVAIIRPGPIVGQMMHPYMERRQGRQEIRYPHPIASSPCCVAPWEYRSFRNSCCASLWSSPTSPVERPRSCAVLSAAAVPPTR